MDLHLDPKMLLGLSANGMDRRNGKGDDPEALRKTCQEFEAIFVQQLFKGMRSTVPKSGLIDGGMTEEVFQDMMDMELSRQAASGQGLGIAEALYRQLQGKHPDQPED